MKLRDSNKGFTFVEFVVVLAIIGIIVSIIWRFYYAAEQIQKENDFFRSIGLDPVVGQILLVVIVVAVFIWKFKDTTKNK